MALQQSLASGTRLGPYEIVGALGAGGMGEVYRALDTRLDRMVAIRFQGSGGTRQVSATGGVRPRWRRDGNELFYIGLDGSIMATPIQRGTGGEVIEPDMPVALFSTPLAEGPSPTNNNKHQYAVSLDGRLLLMNVTVENSIGPPITIVLNWAEELKTKD